MASQSSGEDSKPRGMGLEWTALVLGFLGVAMTLFQPVMQGEFLSDDLNTIVMNPFVQSLSLENLTAILDPYGPAVGYAMNYSPVHLLLHAVEVSFFRNDMYGYHVVNVLLHTCCAVLLVLLLMSSRLSFPIAAAAGVLFLVHPANVEAVAMIFQAKTTLATALSLGALLAFWRHPLLAAVLFGLAILTKFTALTALPVACALYWARRADATRELPHVGWLAAWALVLVVVAIPEFSAFGRVGHGAELDPLVQARTIVAIAMRYLVTAVTSYGIAPFQSTPAAFSWTDLFWLAGIVVLPLLGWRTVRMLIRREEEAAWWLMAAGAFAPVSQIFSFLYPTADRYLYPVLPGLLGGALLASLGPAARASAWLRPRLAAKFADFPIARAAGVTLLLGLSLAFIPRSHAQTRIYVTGNRASAASAEAYPLGVQAWVQKALTRAQAGDAEGAAEALQALDDLGYANFADLAESMGSVRSDPRVNTPLDNMAERTLERFAALDQLFPAEHYFVAQAHTQLGNLPKAIEALEKAVAAGGVHKERFQAILRNTRDLLATHSGP